MGIWDFALPSWPSGGASVCLIQLLGMQSGTISFLKSSNFSNPQISQILSSQSQFSQTGLELGLGRQRWSRQGVMVCSLLTQLGVPKGIAAAPAPPLIPGLPNLPNLGWFFFLLFSQKTVTSSGFPSS